jgi:hypothetical protein
MTRDEMLLRMIDGVIQQATTVRDIILSSVNLDNADTTRNTSTVDGDACEHPEDRRIACPVMGDPGRWICLACSHRNEKGTAA